MYCDMAQNKYNLSEQAQSDRMILKQGHVIDPQNGIDDIGDILIEKDIIIEVADKVKAEPGDRLIDCNGLTVWPGLIDMHLHICDLYEVHTNTAYGAVQDGVTTGLSPGAGNTFMTPALLDAELDRGLPLNTGVYLGGSNVLGSMLSEEELILLFQGRLSEPVKEQKLSRNWITNKTAQYTVGLKEHMGHFLLPDARVQQLIRIAGASDMIFMSHTQDIEHTQRICHLAAGQPVHLGHANAVGCGTHGDPCDSMKEAVRLCQEKNITGEFVTTMLRRGLGSREGLKMTRKAQNIALQACADKVINILVSDGQNQSAMKGFGDTRDNIPCLLELAREKVLTLTEAVAAMTCNPARLLEERTKNSGWKKYGHLGPGAYANIVVVDRDDQLATYVITNGVITAFENRYLRSAGRAGYWVSKFGTRKNMGVGELPLYRVK